MNRELRRGDPIRPGQSGRTHQDASAEQGGSGLGLSLARPGGRPSPTDRVDAQSPARQGTAHENALIAPEADDPGGRGEARAAEVAAARPDLRAACLVSNDGNAAPGHQRVSAGNAVQRVAADHADQGHSGGPYVLGVTIGADAGGALS